MAKAKTPRKRKKAAGGTGRKVTTPQAAPAQTVYVPGAHGGGALQVHPPGSNGGVHRGPDTGLRRNVMRAIIMGALADAGLSMDDVMAALNEKRDKDGNLPHRPVITQIPMAMVHHLKAGLKNIALAAARGDKEAYGPMLRLVEGAHTILQPLRDEALQGHTPKPARFLYTEQLDEAAIAAAAPELPPGQVQDADGKVYE